MEKEFVPCELAVKLKELGFDEKCFAYFEMNGKFHPMGNILTPDGIYFGEFDPNYQYKPDLTPLIAAPLWQQIFDWFREKHNVHSYINLTNIQGELTYHVNICSVDKHEVGLSRVVLCNLFDFKTYEEAKEVCLEKLIEICFM